MNLHRLCIVWLFVSSFVLHPAPFGYITNTGDNTISIIDLATNTPLPQSPISSGGIAPFDIVVIPPSNTQAYISNVTSLDVTILDLATSTIVPPSLAIPQTGGPNWMVAMNTGKVYLNDASFSMKTIIEPNLDVFVIVTIPGIFSGANDLAISPDNTKVYVATGFIRAILTSNDTQLPLTGNFGALSIAITPDNLKGYVGTQSNTVRVINAITNTLNPSPIIPVGSDPGAIAITSDGARAYVANSSSNNVSVIDLSTDTVMATIAVGTQPGSITIAPDNSKVYVVNNGSADVTIIDNTLPIPSVIGSFATGTAPIAMMIIDTIPPAPPVPPVPATATTFSAASVIKNNIFLNKTERVIVITWQVNTSINASSYAIYCGSTVIGTVPASGPLYFSLPYSSCKEDISISALDANNVEIARIIPIRVEC